MRNIKGLNYHGFSLRQTGDTIVEVMVAAALVMATLGIGYALSRQGLRQTTDDTLRNQAISYGQSQIEFIRNAITNYHPGSSVFSATGGVVSTVAPYTIHTFASGGTFTPNGPVDVDFLVVAGGGGGGCGDNGSPGGAGGGAGGVYSGSTSISSGGAIAVTVGNGGAAGNGGGGGNGVDSAFAGYGSATGGGGGARGCGGAANPGSNGGSGGGGARSGIGGSALPVGQGNNGGAGAASTGGGGGGKGAVGAAGGASNGGNGGNGSAYSISGLSVTYAGGGGGGATGAGANGTGGADGGGAGGIPGATGQPNSGGGGGGGKGGSGLGTSGGAGGSGIVIIRYLTPSPGNPDPPTNTLLETYKSASFSPGGFCILNTGQAKVSNDSLCTNYTISSSSAASPISITNSYDNSLMVFKILVQWTPIGTTRDAAAKQQLTLYYRAP